MAEDRFFESQPSDEALPPGDSPPETPGDRAAASAASSAGEANESARQWRVAAASVTGTRHQKRGEPCQDAYAWRQRDRLLLVAVADGAGSAPLADVGAIAATSAAIAALSDETLPEDSPAGEPSGSGAGEGSRASLPETEADWRSRLGRALEAARQAVALNAASRQANPRDLACTLIVAAATPEAIAVAQVGDGAAVAIAPDGSLQALTRPPEGEYANVTQFLTEPDAIAAAQFVCQARSVAGIALFSDGLQRLALQFPEGEPFAPFFAPLFRFAAEARDPDAARDRLAAFLQSPRVTERADDDLTLVLASWPEGDPPAEMQGDRPGA